MGRQTRISYISYVPIWRAYFWNLTTFLAASTSSWQQSILIWSWFAILINNSRITNASMSKPRLIFAIWRVSCISIAMPVLRLMISHPATSQLFLQNPRFDKVDDQLPVSADGGILDIYITTFISAIDGLLTAGRSNAPTRVLTPMKSVINSVTSIIEDTSTPAPPFGCWPWCSSISSWASRRNA